MSSLERPSGGNTPSSDPSITALPTPPNETKKRSTSFGAALSRPKIFGGSGGDEKSSENGSQSSGKLTSKVKEFFGKDKRQASTGSLSSMSPMIPGNDTPPSSINKKPNKPAVLTKPNPNQTSLQQQVVKPTPPSTSPFDFHRDDDFRQAVDSAQKSVDRLTTAAFWLNTIGAGLAAGGGWIPMVGEGVKVVAAMMQSAQNISVAKVAALRLVERCARVMEAVVRALERHQHDLSVAMRQDVDRLMINIHHTSTLLSKLSDRPFFKLWLHSNEVYDQIEEASDDLKSFMDIFQVQSSLSGNALMEQIRKDREADMRILREMLEKGLSDDNLMLGMLVRKNEEQQEAIKTLQRTLDALIASKVTTFSNYTMVESSISSLPASPISHESPANHKIPPYPNPPPLSLPPSRKATAYSEEYGLIRAMSRGYSPEVRTGSYGAMKEASPEIVEAEETAVDEEDPRRQFIEKALDVLRRHSAATDYGVPDWTITSLEVTHEARIASSFFSVVWRGTWQGEAVAMKELNPVVDQSLFIKEVEVWRRLKSRHVLPFLGASSTTGPPPWFLVSPYLKNGNILSYISNTTTNHTNNNNINRLALIHQISQGLEYLHSRDIIHGDFKAANVLITDIGEAVICDFGLSQLKLDITAKSVHDSSSQKTKVLGGTMRWQSPERLQGGTASFACDVFSFAITVCELYDPQTPYGYVDDEIVRKSIIDGTRPARPKDMPETLWQLVNQCWAAEPKDRPSFELVSKELSKMYIQPQSRKGTHLSVSTGASSSSSYTTADEGDQEIVGEQHAISPQLRYTTLPTEYDNSSSSGSIRSIPPHLEKELSFESDRAERHYRHYLQHDFDDRLTIPLWFPSTVPLGSIGYIRHGEFVHLMDADRPPLDINGLPPMPRMDEFSSLKTFSAPVNVRNTAEKGWDMLNAVVANFTKSSGETAQKTISRRLTFPLKPGMKQATLIVDDAQFEIYKSFSEARAYFVANIDWILEHYGESHHLAREDVILVVGTLTAHNWAMIVSNFAPRTTLTFNIHAGNSREAGQPWGTWTVNRLPPPRRPSANPQSVAEEGEKKRDRASSPISPVGGGKVDDGTMKSRLDDHDLKYTCKVSAVSASPMDAVLLAKLRFSPGSTEPTLYP